MKYYKFNGNVYAFEADGSQDAFIPDGARIMSPAEVEDHLNPQRSAADILAALPPSLMRRSSQH